MANAIKKISVQRGYDVTRYALNCFGGAGGQHACLVADALGMDNGAHPSVRRVLSAYGMGLADQTVMKEQAVEVPLEPETMGELQRRRRPVGARCGIRASRAGGRRGPHQHVALAAPALCRHRGGADHSAARSCAIVEDFTAAHRARFGFATPERELVVEAVAVEAISPGER